MAAHTIKRTVACFMWCLLLVSIGLSAPVRAQMQCTWCANTCKGCTGGCQAATRELRDPPFTCYACFGGCYNPIAPDGAQPNAKLLQEQGIQAIAYGDTTYVSYATDDPAALAGIRASDEVIREIAQVNPEAASLLLMWQPSNQPKISMASGQTGLVATVKSARTIEAALRNADAAEYPGTWVNLPAGKNARIVWKATRQSDATPTIKISVPLFDSNLVSAGRVYPSVILHLNAAPPYRLVLWTTAND